MTEQAAREELHTYIRNHGHTPVVVTKLLIKYWWDIINHAVFEGKLNPVGSITLMFSHDVYAWAIPGCNDRITLHFQNRFVERTTFLTVLVHEMVHAWEYQTYGRMGHGKRFNSWATAIERHTPLILRRTIKEHEHTRKRPIRRNKKRFVEHHGCETTGSSTDTDIHSTDSVAERDV
jgi:hypothetical protein